MQIEPSLQQGAAHAKESLPFPPELQQAVKEEKLSQDDPNSRYLSVNMAQLPETAKKAKFASNHVSTSKCVLGDTIASKTLCYQGLRFTAFGDAEQIRSCRYNIVTFLPLFLFGMFSRMAYLYFLIQACLSWWDLVSPWGPAGSTAALVFVLIAAGLKAVIEDKKRHVEDNQTNNTPTTVVEWTSGAEGSEKGHLADRVIKWSDVKVGDIIKVKDDELVPADLLCLYSTLPEDICYVKTTNLDGETNLKIKRQAWDKAYAPPGCADPGAEAVVARARLELECELPSGNLHHFTGKLGVHVPAADGSSASTPRFSPVTMNEMLLRGCMLKNTGHVLGVVVYTGSESRIQQNSVAGPLKIGSYDHFLNVQVTILIIIQFFLCVMCALLSYWWRESYGKDRYYMEFNVYRTANPSSGILYILLVFLTFWILFSYLVPISLFVTLEIVKFWQGFIFINNDPGFREKGIQEGARCRNSNLNEDLGKIDYVFSDKTGTLTSNEMRLRMIAIKGQVYGDPGQCLEDFAGSGMAALERFDAKLAGALTAVRSADKRWAAALARGGSSSATMALSSSHPEEGTAPPRRQANQGDNGAESLSEALPAAEQDEAPFPGENGGHLPYHLVDFLTNLAMCHSLIVEKNPVEGGLPLYQGPSPDEVALVEGARQLGFEFVARSSRSISINVLGTPVEHTLLNLMEFSSERQRMSVIVQSADGSIKLYAKGADAMMLKRLHPDTDPALLSRVDANLHFFSTRGLRTLMVGARVLTRAEYDAWRVKYEAAQTFMGANAAEKMNAVCDEIEKDLELIGVTAIEDKLQNAVPESIARLLAAGIKVWMITGDKQETAINIAVSCNLFKSSEHGDLLICNSTSAEAASKRLEELTRRAQEANALSGGFTAQLVIDGKTLNSVLGNGEVERKLAVLGSLCGAVVVCRASPSQKANIVNLMRRFELERAQEGKTWWLTRWIARLERKLAGKLLSIGDGANDVAMIQAADVGIGIAGKEGRQAVNNADYAITQFHHLTRLLLVHGSLSRYRIAGLIKYSFYKNMCFSTILFIYQCYSGFSGQTIVDDISAAAYNVLFTALPIGFFAVLDRQLDFATMHRFPQIYNRSRGLSLPVFWKTGVAHGIVDATICFMVCYYAASASGPSSITDMFSVGKTIFIALLGAVSLEMAVTPRYWTGVFAVVLALSYLIVFPYVLVYPLFLQAIDTWDMSQTGVGVNLFSTAYFWVSIITCYLLVFGIRFFERAVKWVFIPDDEMLLADIEALGGVSEVEEPQLSGKADQKAGQKVATPESARFYDAPEEFAARPADPPAEVRWWPPVDADAVSSSDSRSQQA